MKRTSLFCQLPLVVCMELRSAGEGRVIEHTRARVRSPPPALSKYCATLLRETLPRTLAIPDCRGGRAPDPPWRSRTRTPWSGPLPRPRPRPRRRPLRTPPSSSSQAAALVKLAVGHFSAVASGTESLCLSRRSARPARPGLPRLGPQIGHTVRGASR